MGIELQSETRIVIGRLGAPRDPELPWWWQSSTTIDGVDHTVAGFARTESDAILDAAARTLDLRAALDRAEATAPAAQPDAWGLNGSRAPERDLDLERSTSG